MTNFQQTLISSIVLNYLSYFQFFGHHLVQYLRKFNTHKLRSTSHFFKQLLENDKLKYDETLKQLRIKKKKIDKIMKKYNQAINLQGCKETLGK